MSNASKKVLVGLKFNRQNVEGVAIYDINKDKTVILSTKEAKELYSNKRLSVANADFNFFVNKVNFHIGEQKDYPIIFENKDNSGKIQRKIENAIIIYNINKTDDEKYKTIIIKNNKIHPFELREKELKELYLSKGYKYNYLIEKNKLKIIYKEDGIQKEYLEDDTPSELLFNAFKKWYKLENGRMEKVTDCNQSTFEITHGEKIIDGFANSDVIEEVDLSGAIYIAPKAFLGCSNLKKVILSDSLQKIGSYAFANCPKLKELEIPKATEEIGIRIFDHGTVYLEKDIRKNKNIITPFGANTKIILAGKEQINTDTLKIAYKEDKTKLYYIEIETENGKSKNKEIKKSDIDVLTDIFINYKNNKVLKGDIIICGKSGLEYVFLNKKAEVVIDSFDNIKKYKISNGTVTSKEILPIIVDWGWYSINLGNTNKNSKVGAQLVELADSGKILSSPEKIIMAEYVNKKFETKYGKIILNSGKSDKKIKEEKDKFPEVKIWIYGGLYPGGIACDNPPKVDEKTGKAYYKSANGNYLCYFGHETENHILAKGLDSSGKVIKRFTFGGTCASKFLEIDPQILNRIKEFQGILVDAIDEITEVIKHKSYAKFIKDHKKFYEIIQVINKNNAWQLLGPYSEIAKKCLDYNLAIPKELREDIQKYIKNNENQYEIYKYCLDNEKLNLVYYFNILEDKNNNNTKLSVYKEILDDYLYYIDEIIDDKYKSLSDLNKLLKSISVDNEEYKKVEDIKKQFDKLGLDNGKYILNEQFIVNTYNCSISNIDLDYGRYNLRRAEAMEVCSLNKPVTNQLIQYINSIDKKNYRPTIGEYKYEYLFAKKARLLKELLNVDNLPENKVRILYRSYYSNIVNNKNLMIALAYKNNLYGFGTDNYNKPIYLYKNGKINFNEDYGIFDALKFKYNHKTYSGFYDETQDINNKIYIIDIDYNTFGFKFSDITKIIKLNTPFTDENRQLYIQAKNNLDLNKYNYQPFYETVDLDAENKRLETFYKKLKLDTKKNFILISKVFSIDSRVNTYGIIHQNNINYILDLEDNKNYNRIIPVDSPVKIFKLNEKILADKYKRNGADKYFNDINEVRTIIYYNKPIKDEDISNLSYYLPIRKINDILKPEFECLQSITFNTIQYLLKDKGWYINNKPIIKIVNRTDDCLTLAYDNTLEFTNVGGKEIKENKYNSFNELKNDLIKSEEIEKENIKVETKIENKNKLENTKNTEQSKNLLFIDTLKNNLDKIDEWADAKYINLYKSISNQILNNKELSIKQLRVKDYIQKALEKYLNITF